MKRIDLSKPGKANCHFLENDVVRVAVDKQAGVIRSFLFKATGVDPFTLLRQNMPGTAGYLRVHDEHAGRTFNDLTDACRLTRTVKRGNKLTMTKKFAGAEFVLTETLELQGDFLAWKVDAVKATTKTADRSLRVGFNLPMHAGWNVWAPCAGGDFAFDGMTNFNFNYTQIPYVSPRDIILPMVSHYNPSLNVGYSLMEPLDAMVPAACFQFETGEKRFNWGYNQKPLATLPTLEACNYYIGLVGKAPMSTQTFVVFHEGDWRPAVGKVYRKWQAFFDPDSPEIYESEGLFHCGSVFTSDLLKENLAVGLKTLEVHGHFQYYSDYFQEGQDDWVQNHYQEGLYRHWLKNGREATAHEVWEWMNTHTDEDLAREMHGDQWREKIKTLPIRNVRTEIKRRLKILDDAGISCFWYFNFTDGFRPVVEKKWPDAICKDQDGKPIPSGWQLCHNMLADPRQTTFGRFTEESAYKILAEYPTLKGFFLDCFRHFEVEYGHHDGVTVVNGRPAYSVNFSYDELTRRMKKHMHALNRPLSMFANKPQTIRSMRYADGVLLEGDGDTSEEKFFWACIAKPLFFMWTSNRAGLDENLRRSVVLGSFPRTPNFGGEGKTEDLIALYTPYLPLYEPFRRRVLCFEPDPLRVPRGARGKLYTLPDGSYVAGIATPQIAAGDKVVHAKTPYALFRVARGHDVSKAGVMYPGDTDWRFVQFKFNGSIIAVPLAEYSSCAVVKLFVTGNSGKPIGAERFVGPVDFCGDPESSFQDISKR